jgi:hypothetical protein
MQGIMSKIVAECSMMAQDVAGLSESIEVLRLEDCRAASEG